MFCSGCVQIASEELEGGHGSSKKHKPKICFSCSRADKEIRKKQQEAETLENLEKKYKEIAIEHSAKSVQRLRTNEDKELERRLKELRSSPQASRKVSSIPTVKALEQRLEKLKATASDSSSPNTSKKENTHNPEPSVDKKDLLLPSKKTEAEETLDLMKQMADEAKIEETGRAQDEELSQRLYNLKSNSQNPSANIQTPPARSTEEQASETDSNVEINKLINYAIEEHKLEEQKRKENDAFIASCAARLHKLTDEAAGIAAEYSEEVRSKLPPDGNVKRKSLSTGNYPLDDLSEEYIDAEVQKLVEQFAAEVELDRKNEQFLGNIGYDETSIQAVPTISKPPLAGEELPWCCICNDDATLRCYDCDDDLYCQRCFQDGHQQFHLFDHKYVAFTKPNQNSSVASNK